MGYRYESGHCVRYSCNTPHTCQVGDVYLHDNEPIGVVFFDDGTTTKIVALNNVDTSGEENNISMSWSTDKSGTYSYTTGNTYHTNETNITDMNGKKNTSTILSYISTNGYIAQAARATSLYAPNVCKGTGVFCDTGNWYLPALGELVTMHKNLNSIDFTLNKIDGTILNHWKYYHFWSSTEKSTSTSWTLLFSRGYQGDYDMKYLTHYYVRPVLAF